MPHSVVDSDSVLSEEPKPVFRPFTRESLLAIKSRVAEEEIKKRELEQKRADGEVKNLISSNFL